MESGKSVGKRVAIAVASISGLQECNARPPFAPGPGPLGFSQQHGPHRLALRPMAGQRTLDPLMVVRIHQGQLDLANCGPGAWDRFALLTCPGGQKAPGRSHSKFRLMPTPAFPTSCQIY